MIALLIAAAVSAAPVAPPARPLASLGPSVRGSGASSCAAWQDNEGSRLNGNAWVLGYFSGLNAMNTKAPNVGDDTDGPGIIAEAQKTCADHPSALLANIAAAVYLKMWERTFPK